MGSAGSCGIQVKMKRRIHPAILGIETNALRHSFKKFIGWFLARFDHHPGDTTFLFSRFDHHPGDTTFLVFRCTLRGSKSKIVDAPILTDIFLG
jgi:hypothetical protein